MGTRPENLKQSISRHGYLKTASRYVYRRLRRFIDFEICVVQTSSGAAYDWPDVENYETRIVTLEEFRNQLSPELDERGVDWPFQRGDECAASLIDNQIVGYSFYTYQDTIVRRNLVFLVPEGYVYGFKSFTATSHRGRRLESERWKAARFHRNEVMGQDPKTIYYINVTNLESLATNKMTEVITLGYAAYAELCGHVFVLNSPGCRKYKTGFAVDAKKRNFG